MLILTNNAETRFRERTAFDTVPTYDPPSPPYFIRSQDLIHGSSITLYSVKQRRNDGSYPGKKWSEEITNQINFH